MNEEKKKYPMDGCVLISSEEYRELIEELANAKAEERESNGKRWEEYRRANEAEEKLKQLTEKINRVEKDMNDNGQLTIRQSIKRLLEMEDE